MLETVKCEAEKELIGGVVYYKTDGQSWHKRPDGSTEQSYGLAMWYIPAGNKTKDGTVFTEAMAKDPVLALNTMAWYFSMGWQKKWTCYQTNP